MAIDRLFSRRRGRRGRVRWLWLLVLAPAVLLLRPLFGTVEPVQETQAYTEVVVPPLGSPTPPGLTAASAILMDADTGTILYQKHPHARRPMASLTKMMTGILAIEHGHLDDVVTASANASKTPFTGLYLKEGEKVKLRDLLWGLLLRSANDACVAAGEKVAGSEAKFVEMMNAKAKALGLKDTHFMNPHGLNADGHYSSAYDLAQIARCGLQKPLFAEIVGHKYHRIGRSIEKKDEVVVNKNRLLFRWDRADGVKTGYTKEAGHCLAASASANGWRLIAVVLKSADSWTESRTLLQWGMSRFQQVVVAKKGTPLATVQVLGGLQPKVQAIVAKDIATVAPRGARVDLKTQVAPGKMRAPVKQGDMVGTLVARRGDREIGRALLLAAASVEPQPLFRFPGSIVSIAAAIGALLILAAGARYGRKVAQGSGGRRRRLTP